MDSDHTTTHRCNAATLRRATLLGLLLLLVLLASATVTWLLTTPSGARGTFGLLRYVSAGAIQATAINGRLIGPLHIGELTLQSTNSNLQLQAVQVDWRPAALREGLLHITLLRAATLRLTLPAATDALPTLPATLQLPMRLQIDRLTIARTVVQQPLQKSRQLDAADFGVQFDGQRYRVMLNGLTLASANPVSGLVRGQMTLTATTPYAVEARIQMPNAIWRNGEISQQALHAAGTLGISGDLSTLQLALSARALSVSTPIDLTASAILNRDRLLVSAATLQQGQAHAGFSGAINFSGERDFFLHAILHHVQLDSIVAQKGWPSMLLNGSLDAKGKLGRPIKPALALQFALHESRIDGHRLSGQGQLALTPDSIGIDRLDLRAGVNTLTAQGRLSEHGGALGFSVHAPKLTQLGPQFSGTLTVDGSATGNIARVLLALRWQASKLRLPAALMIGMSEGSAQLTLAPQQAAVIEAIDVRASAHAIQLGTRAAGSLQLDITAQAKSDAPLQVKLMAQDLLIDKFRADRLNATLSGTRAQHTASAVLVSRKETLHLEAAGGLVEADAPDLVWRGSLTQAESRGVLRITMRGHAGLIITAHSVQLNALTLQSTMGTVIVEQFRRDTQGIASEGRIDQFDAGQMLSLFAQFQSPDKSKNQIVQHSDLELDGDWDLQIFPAATYPLQGTVRLHRRSGDIVLRAAQPLTLGLQKLDLRASAAQGQLTLALETQGQQLGRLQLEGSAPHAPASWLPDRHAPMAGVLTLQVPSMAWVAALLSEKLITDGSLESTLRFAGTPATPIITGRITGRQLRLIAIDSGINLHDGVFEGVFAGDTLTIQQCQFAGRSGTVSAKGPVRFSEAHAEARLYWKAQKFSVSDRIDSALIVSGEGHLIGGDGRFKAEGTLLVDRGQIDIDRTAAPHLSDDVIVAGRQRAPPQALLMDLDMTVGLGDQLRLRGRGINASLGGAVRVRSEAGEALSVAGLMQVTRGTYRAYGRELAIERGMARFDGAPTNPALDIRAMRRGTAVEAGVAIGGSALAPRVTLVSEPPVPDAEKLSWLVLGQGLSTASGNDADVLQSAAASLLSHSAAAGVQVQIASALGVDSVSLSKSQDTLQKNIVTLGKRLSSKLYMSYQQGLQTAGAAVLLRYTLSPRLAIEAEAGTRSVLSLFYNISFD